MAKLSGGTVLTNPETGQPVYLAEGADVPDWAKDLVGDHLIASDPKKAAAPPAK